MLRLATGIPLGIVVLFVVAYPRSWSSHFLLFIVLPAVVFSLRELFVLMGLKEEATGKLSPLALLGLLFGAFLVLMAHQARWDLFPSWAIAFLMALALIQLPRFPGNSPLFREPMQVLFGTLWIAGGLSALFGLRDLSEAWSAMGCLPPLHFNPLCAIPVFGAWGYDSCALGTGAALGTTPMAPNISPKKSWEGFIGGLAGAGFSLVGLLWMISVLALTPWHPPVSAYPFVFLFGMILGACSQLGDLMMSCLKREAHVKDSSGLIPHQGGLLDKVDGFLMVAPVAYALLPLLMRLCGIAL